MNLLVNTSFPHGGEKPIVTRFTAMQKYITLPVQCTIQYTKEIHIQYTDR